MERRRPAWLLNCFGSPSWCWSTCRWQCWCWRAPISPSWESVVSVVLRSHQSAALVGARRTGGSTIGRRRQELHCQIGALSTLDREPPRRFLREELQLVGHRERVPQPASASRGARHVLRQRRASDWRGGRFKLPPDRAAPSCLPGMERGGGRLESAACNANQNGPRRQKQGSSSRCCCYGARRRRKGQSGYTS